MPPPSWLAFSLVSAGWRETQARAATLIAAVGRHCGNGGVFPGRARQSRLSPPQSQQRHPVWRVRAFLCVCGLWHSPLSEASPHFKDSRLGLRFQQLPQVSQPTPKPLPQKLPDFSSQTLPQLQMATGRRDRLGWVNGAAVAVVSAATAVLLENHLHYETTTAA